LTRAVILDTDFLSAFLKIGRLELVRNFYSVEAVIVPAAVVAELSRTSLLDDLVWIAWIRIEVVEHDSSSELSHKLGPGEREAIALARRQGALLLSNDNLARQAASRLGVEAIDIPAFLLSCKLTGFLDGDEIREVVRELREKDHYGFRKEILDRLLA
jgi:predicted nucleic acid-binding protein